MKIALFATATAAVALLGSAAVAQQTNAPKPPTPGSVTGDWNGAHAPSDDKQYTETVRVPLGAPAGSARIAPPVDGATTSTDASATTDATVTSEATTPAPSATDAAQSVSVTTSTVTNGPVPDTAENRAKYGKPMSRAGQRTAAKGN